MKKVVITALLCVIPCSAMEVITNAFNSTLKIQQILIENTEIPLAEEIVLPEDDPEGPSMFTFGENESDILYIRSSHQLFRYNTKTKRRDDFEKKKNYTYAAFHKSWIVTITKGGHLVYCYPDFEPFKDADREVSAIAYDPQQGYNDPACLIRPKSQDNFSTIIVPGWKEIQIPVRTSGALEYDPHQQNQLAVGYPNGVYILNTHTGKCLWNLQEERKYNACEPIMAISYNHHHKGQLASMRSLPRSDTIISLWNTITGEKIANIYPEIFKICYNTSWLAYHSNEDQLAVSCRNRIYFYDLSSITSIIDWFKKGCHVEKKEITLEHDGVEYKKLVDFSVLSRDLNLKRSLLSSVANYLKEFAFGKGPDPSIQEQAAYKTLLPDFIQQALENIKKKEQMVNLNNK